MISAANMAMLFMGSIMQANFASTVNNWLLHVADVTYEAAEVNTMFTVLVSQHRPKNHPGPTNRNECRLQLNIYEIINTWEADVD